MYEKAKTRYDKYISRNADIVGDIALWNLPYAEQFLKFKNVKIVALKRDRTDTISSFEKWFSKWNHFPWAEIEVQVENGFKPNKRYDACYKKFKEFGTGQKVEVNQGASLHYDDYYKEVDFLKELYPDRVRIVDTYEILNSGDAKRELFKWLNMEAPYTIELGKHAGHNTNQKRLNEIKAKYEN